VLNSALRRAFESAELDFEHIRTLLEAAAREKVNLDATGLEFVLRRRMNGLAAAVMSHPDDESLLATLDAAVAMARSLPFEVNLWKVQNAYYYMLQQHAGDDGWGERLTRLGERLGFRMAQANIETPQPKEEAPAAA
jgi:hypothetical protein